MTASPITPLPYSIPTPPNWQMISPTQMELRFGHSTLRLNQDGTIELIGKQILQHAEQTIMLQSYNDIHLNTLPV